MKRRTGRSTDSCARCAPAARSLRPPDRTAAYRYPCAALPAWWWGRSARTPCHRAAPGTW
ncbi:hypothetical protein [Cupriavidus oxalaticus]|uniref:hypothetical protein n=1 Tax=Cupriavidus oxalaticus TaxID=96344 RepID=UPI003D1749C6